MSSTITSEYNALGVLLSASSTVHSRSFVASSTATKVMGTAGVDAIRGNGRGDLLAGGAGDDTYYVSSTKDHIVEGVDKGTDTVVSSGSWTLGANVENLELTNAGTFGIGNSLDNIIKSDAGSQWLDGGAGNDVLVAGTGVDIFAMENGGGHDTIVGFKNGIDNVHLNNYVLTNFSQVQADLTQVGANVLLTVSPTDSILFTNHEVNDFSAKDFGLSVDTSSMKKTFDDEFTKGLSIWNGTSGTWRTTGQGSGEDMHHINEQENVYVDSTWHGTDGKMAAINPFSVQNGILDITATQLTAAQSADNYGLDWASGILTTKPSFSQEYGYFDVRAKLPAGQGFWPAFWLMPENGSWPPELDVMEDLGGNPNTVYMTSHSDATGTHTYVQSAAPVSGVTTSFHDYGVLWTPTELVWYIDGNKVAEQATPSDMNTPMYMLLNLGVGDSSAWGGGPNSSTPTSATMQVNYVRAYSLADVPASVATSATPALTTSTAATTTTSTTATSTTASAATQSAPASSLSTGGAGNDPSNVTSKPSGNSHPGQVQAAVAGFASAEGGTATNNGFLHLNGFDVHEGLTGQGYFTTVEGVGGLNPHLMISGHNFY
ncbi:family 16 glycosylhydrolase [Caulobacter sp. S45]|uniref:family 16 glycosylhydrolase n=1 Tax=Caulobacter sp. S45 TaxID=1641861 RepID=UPI0015761560|nr:family 16 glycosylhydrolase [Caulobacter sp. S45]